MRSKYGFETTTERSSLMSKIKGVNTKPEINFRKALWSKGFRYRLNVKSIPGKPDIVIKKYHIVIFIDGEFWHGYNWETKKKKIKANKEYWIKKIEGNINRDLKNNELLKNQGWRVFRFWEKDIRKNLNHCIDEVIDYIQTLNQNPDL